MNSNIRLFQALVRGFWLCVLMLTFAGVSRPAAAAAPHLTHSNVIDLWGGGSESIALQSDGSVWTWGWDDYGMLGNGHGPTMFDTTTQYDSLIPFKVLGANGVGHLNAIVAIAGAERQNSALDANGEIWTWGWNYFGQLGYGTYCSNMNAADCMGTTPAKIPGFTNVTAIASRGYHTLALKKDGTVWAWGYNNWGQIGDGTNTDRHSPALVSGLNGHGKVLAISGGGDISAALMEDHTLMAWGNNEHGAVGNGTTSLTGQWSPVPVVSSGLTYVKVIATGWNHMIAIDQNDTVWTWGNGQYGELGNGSTADSSVPFHVSGLTNVIQVSAGDGSSVALKSDGTVWAWGALRTQVGTNQFAVYNYGSTPVQVSGIDHVTLLRDRDWHVLALKQDGTVWAWGWNLKGQIGDGTVGGDKLTPVQVQFSTDPVPAPNFSVFLPLEVH